jgi:hypothetical protein
MIDTVLAAAARGRRELDRRLEVEIDGGIDDGTLAVDV